MYKYKAKVAKVVDGDTIDLIIDVGFKMTTNQRIRLAGLNTPETYNVKKDTEEYQKGMAAKQYVAQRLEANNNQVIVDTEKETGKYGRYIGTITLSDSDITLNDELIQKGFAAKMKY